MRVDPPDTGSERELVEGFLEFHRATLELKCHGVAAERLRDATVPPSNLSLQGLIRHMTDVERYWFRRRIAGEAIGPVYWDGEGEDRDFDNIGNQDFTKALASWRNECARSREVLDHVASLDEPAHDLSEDPRTVSVRWVLIHMIEEYARHNGHADLIRERIDGATGE